MFTMFVNMFLRAEGFGCMWVLFEFESMDKLCLVFSHEWQKANLGRQHKIYFLTEMEKDNFLQEQGLSQNIFTQKKE